MNPRRISELGNAIMDGYMISVADHDGAYPSTPPRQTARDHRESKRMRVTRACDRCKKRKIRCTGLQPCRLCIEANASCTYDAAYTRGKHGGMASRRTAHASPPQPQPPQQHERQPSRSEPSRWHPANRSSSAASGRPPQPAGEPPDSSYSALGDPTQPGTEPLSRASPEPVQTDLEGHYVGPSSGVSFLLRIQKRLDQFVSFPQGSSSIFTFGDAPLPYLDSLQAGAPYFDPMLYMMLSRGDTTRLVQRYFDFAVPVDRFLHQQTIEAWLNELYETKGRMHNREDASTRTAVLFMVFALAQAHMSPRPSAEDADVSVRYFLAADQLLSREQGAIRLASIQARLLQCLWLLSESRINHCWNLFGTAARLAYAIGLHRKRHADRIDRVEVECRRRTFWSAYALDNYLSMALGRPRTFHDDDIDQELPSCVDDHQIHGDHISQGSAHGQSVMLGPVAYANVRMSRILSMILRNVYSIHSTSRNDKHAFATIHTKELVEWRADVAHFLDPVTNMPLIPIFQRQKNVLNLAYWHTMILTHRPFLLRNFAQLQNGSRPRRDDREFESRIEQSVQECLKAATNITKAVDDMYQGGQLFRAYWFTSYFAFSAAVILYVYTIQKSNESEESYSGYLAAATRCQDQLSNLAEDGSLVARYCLVLEELRLEALRQTKQGQINNARSPAQRQAAAMANAANGTEGFGSAEDGAMGVRELGANMTDMGGIGDIYVTPTDSLAEMTGWAQFDAMVSVSMDGFQLNI
ncbi:hypothetical protein CCMA1212_007333 [Trichoderma ghanense]|uniref:Zn(2)-C6 fungal-type domain-containing protein n=1 Tax=Trichoderma ghanense TaxID=65468 RepID=A0ABY2GXK1_9HYPO